MPSRGPNRSSAPPRGVNVASAWTLRAGDLLRRLQTGRAQDYLYAVTAGFLLVLVLWRLWA